MQMPGNNVRGVIVPSNPTIAGVISDNRVIGLQLSRELPPRSRKMETSELWNAMEIRWKIACRSIF